MERGEDGTTSSGGSLASADTLVGGTAEGTGAPGRELRSGDVLNHFVILELAGEGGMGVVYTAYDQHLDRKVAIKLLRPDRPRAPTAQDRQRLLREAHALAKLNHPNVVAVHDVFECDGQTYVAMEYVGGGTLASWARDADRTWREIVDAYRLAGRGLAAAHRAGLIHRDFKPANVLYGSDGRIRVTDFGLARATGGATEEPIAPPSGRAPTSTPLSAELTEHGEVVGTPGYVAPELYRGAAADERADQFSFCVALYEALHGDKPFPGQTGAEVAAAVLRGDLRDPPDDDVPPWIDRVLRRGLASDPADRYPSMDELLAILADDPEARRRRRLVLGAIAVAFVGLVGLAIFGLTRAGAAADQVCQGADERVARVWGPGPRQAIQRAFAATERPYAGQVFERVAGRVDRYTADWSAMRIEACRATRVHREQSSAALDARMACLDRRLGELAAVVDLLSGKADPQVMDRAVQSVAGLRPVVSCADASALMAEQPTLTAEQRARREPLERELARVRALAAAGKYEDAERAATQLVSTPAVADAPALRAEALILAGDLQDSLGRAEEAEATLRDAIAAAAPLPDRSVAAEAWITRLWVVGYSLARRQAAAELALVADAAVVRADDDPRLRADLAKKLGGVHMRHGEYDRSLAEYERALALVEEEYGLEHPDRAVAMGNLGNVLWRLGEHDRARAMLEQALALDRELLGDGHPDLAYSLATLGHLSVDAGELGQALDRYQQALAIREAALGSDHPDVAMSLSMVGQVYEQQGKLDDALDRYGRAIAITIGARGEEHPDVAGLLTNKARALALAGRRDEAIASYRRAAAIWERTMGPEHPDLGIALLGLAELHAGAGDCGKATPLYRRALSLFEAGFGADHANVEEVKEGLARCAAR